MPNYSYNTLIISGPRERRADAVLTMAGHNHDWEDRTADDLEAAEHVLNELDKNNSRFTPLCFRRIIPIPEDIRRKGYQDAGYNWSVANWGTKWQVEGSDVEYSETPRTLIYNFQTAWSPPIPIVEKLSRLYPELTFNLYADIEGDGKYQIKYKNGKIIKEVSK